MDSTTFGLSAKKLVRLLRIGSGGKSDESRSDNRAALLQNWLDAPLPSEIMSTRLSALAPNDQMPVMRLLTDPTDLAVIMALKDQAKAQVG